MSAQSASPSIDAQFRDSVVPAELPSCLAEIIDYAANEGIDDGIESAETDTHDGSWLLILGAGDAALVVSCCSGEGEPCKIAVSEVSDEGQTETIIEASRGVGGAIEFLRSAAMRLSDEF